MWVQSAAELIRPDAGLFQRIARREGAAMDMTINCCSARVRFWHIADMSVAFSDVRFWG